MPLSFTDPIHKRVSVSDRHQELIRSVALSRLRNIRQLGFTLSTYSGAVHTRFEHTLGTAAVLDRLLTQFDVTREDIRERYIVSALLSEIGIYPMSYCARAVFDDGKDAKEHYKRLVYTTFLERELGIPWVEEEAFSRSDALAHQWFRDIPGMDEFSYLTPIRLASTIDYVLRDGYYSGRYAGIFDYRFFNTIRLADSYDTRREMRGALRELHRAAHVLNSIYGDRTRRFLTAVLARLGRRLAGKGLLNLNGMKEVSAFVELDDDVFFAAIGAATERAVAAGDDLSGKMFQIVSQTRSVEVRSLQIDDAGPLPRKSDLEAEIAKREAVLADAVVCLGDRLEDDIGFRLFGREFPSYSDAVMSDYFAQLTGLSVPDDRTGLERTGTVSFIVI